MWLKRRFLLRNSLPGLRRWVWRERKGRGDKWTHCTCHANWQSENILTKCALVQPQCFLLTQNRHCKCVWWVRRVHVVTCLLWATGRRNWINCKFAQSWLILLLSCQGKPAKKCLPKKAKDRLVGPPSTHQLNSEGQRSFGWWTLNYLFVITNMLYIQV